MQEIKLWTRKFFQNFGQYLFLVLSISLLTELVLIPFFRLLTTFILQAGKIPFISSQNIRVLLRIHPWVCLELLLELVAIVIIIYLEFSYLMIGVKKINENEFDLKKVIFQTGMAFKQLRIGSAFYLILYFILIVPVIDIIYRTPLLAEMHLPQFIADYLTRSSLLVGILIIGYLLILYLGWRSIFVLPLIIIQQYSIKKARKKSWRLTSRKAYLGIGGQLFLIIVFSTTITFLIYGIILGLQLLEDLLLKKLAFGFVQVNLLLIQMVAFVMLSYTVELCIVKLLNILDNKQKFHKVSDSCHKVNFLFRLSVLIELGLAFFNNSFYLQNLEAKRPKIISHRGVSEKNGVQNTLAALKKTVRLKPDYVEIDLHETADKKLIVMHDENLKKLANRNLRPHDLKLKQLQKITVAENSYREKIVSFDEYLKEAQRFHQKLLIEIKTTPKDSPKLLKRFNKKYGKIILKRNYQVQSLDYHVIEELHRLNPKLFLIYLQSYNLAYPSSVANGYAMEYSTLNNSFIWQAHLQKKIVYAWTVNKSNIIKKMMFLHVNGIITDDVQETKYFLKVFNQENTYANQLLNYVSVF